MKCRFGFPRFPSEETVIADSTLLANLSEEEQNSLIKRYQKILSEARIILESKNIDENMSYADFIKLLGSRLNSDTFEDMNNEYKNALKTTKHGCMIILKRKVKERYINNYNVEWMFAWKGNHDIQVAFDTFAVITYVVSYLGKEESGLASLLQKALEESSANTLKEQHKVLKSCYTTFRQCGAAEAIYRIFPSMHLRESNIICEYVASGFPKNRGVFYHKVKENPSEHYGDIESELTGENIGYSGDTIQIEGRIGHYRQSVTISDRYSNRPIYLQSMCLAQFATFYIFSKTIPAKIKIEDNYSKDEMVLDMHIFGTDISLPKYIKLEGISGFMRLRTNPSVIRFHSPKKKAGHEQHYAEIFLFSAWKNESRDIPKDLQACVSKYASVEEEIKRVRREMFPLEDEFDLSEMDFDDHNQLPQHIFDQLDPEGEQNNQEDLEIGPQEDDEFAGRDNDFAPAEESEPYEDCTYPRILIPCKEDLLQEARNLDEDQYHAFEKVVGHCKKARRSMNSNTLEPVEALRLIVHGGAGNLLCEIIFT